MNLDQMKNKDFLLKFSNIYSIENDIQQINNLKTKIYVEVSDRLNLVRLLLKFRLPFDWNEYISSSNIMNLESIIDKKSWLDNMDDTVPELKNGCTLLIYDRLQELSYDELDEITLNGIPENSIITITNQSICYKDNDKNLRFILIKLPVYGQLQLTSSQTFTDEDLTITALTIGDMFTTNNLNNLQLRYEAPKEIGTSMIVDKIHFDVIDSNDNRLTDQILTILIKPINNIAPTIAQPFKENVKVYKTGNSTEYLYEFHINENENILLPKDLFNIKDHDSELSELSIVHMGNDDSYIIYNQQNPKISLQRFKLTDILEKKVYIKPLGKTKSATIHLKAFDGIQQSNESMKLIINIKKIDDDEPYFSRFDETNFRYFCNYFSSNRSLCAFKNLFESIEDSDTKEKDIFIEFIAFPLFGKILFQSNTQQIYHIQMKQLYNYLQIKDFLLVFKKNYPLNIESKYQRDFFIVRLSDRNENKKNYTIFIQFPKEFFEQDRKRLHQKLQEEMQMNYALPIIKRNRLLVMKEKSSVIISNNYLYSINGYNNQSTNIFYIYRTIHPSNNQISLLLNEQIIPPNTTFTQNDINRKKLKLKRMKTDRLPRQIGWFEFDIICSTNQQKLSKQKFHYEIQRISMKPQIHGSKLTKIQLNRKINKTKCYCFDMTEAFFIYDVDNSPEELNVNLISRNPSVYLFKNNTKSQCLFEKGNAIYSFKISDILRNTICLNIHRNYYDNFFMNFTIDDGLNKIAYDMEMKQSVEIVRKENVSMTISSEWIYKWNTRDGSCKNNQIIDYYYSTNSSLEIEKENDLEKYKSIYLILKSGRSFNLESSRNHLWRVTNQISLHDWLRGKGRLRMIMKEPKSTKNKISISLKFFTTNSSIVFYVNGKKWNRLNWIDIIIKIDLKEYFHCRNYLLNEIELLKNKGFAHIFQLSNNPLSLNDSYGRVITQNELMAINSNKRYGSISNIVYKIQTQPKYGRVMRDNSIVSMFSQIEINNRKIFYELDYHSLLSEENNRYRRYSQYHQMDERSNLIPTNDRFTFFLCNGQNSCRRKEFTFIIQWSVIQFLKQRLPSTISIVTSVSTVSNSFAKIEKNKNSIKVPAPILNLKNINQKDYIDIVSALTNDYSTWELNYVKTEIQVGELLVKRIGNLQHHANIDCLTMLNEQVIFSHQIYFDEGESLQPCQIVTPLNKSEHVYKIVLTNAQYTLVSGNDELLIQLIPPEKLTEKDRRSLGSMKKYLSKFNFTDITLKLKHFLNEPIAPKKNIQLNINQKNIWLTRINEKLNLSLRLDGESESQERILVECLIKFINGTTRELPKMSYEIEKNFERLITFLFPLYFQRSSISVNELIDNNELPHIIEFRLINALQNWTKIINLKQILFKNQDGLVDTKFHEINSSMKHLENSNSCQLQMNINLQLEQFLLSYEKERTSTKLSNFDNFLFDVNSLSCTSEQTKRTIHVVCNCTMLECRYFEKKPLILREEINNEKLEIIKVKQISTCPKKLLSEFDLTFSMKTFPFYEENSMEKNEINNFHFGDMLYGLLSLRPTNEQYLTDISLIGIDVEIRENRTLNLFDRSNDNYLDDNMYRLKYKYSENRLIYFKFLLSENMLNGMNVKNERNLFKIIIKLSIIIPKMSDEMKLEFHNKNMQIVSKEKYNNYVKVNLLLTHSFNALYYETNDKNLIETGKLTDNLLADDPMDENKRKDDEYNAILNGTVSFHRSTTLLIVIIISLIIISIIMIISVRCFIRRSSRLKPSDGFLHKSISTQNDNNILSKMSFASSSSLTDIMNTSPKAHQINSTKQSMLSVDDKKNNIKVTILEDEDESQHDKTEEIDGRMKNLDTNNNIEFIRNLTKKINGTSIDNGKRSRSVFSVNANLHPKLLPEDWKFDSPLNSTVNKIDAAIEQAEEHLKFLFINDKSMISNCSNLPLSPTTTTNTVNQNIPECNSGNNPNDNETTMQRIKNSENIKTLSKELSKWKDNHVTPFYAITNPSYQYQQQRFEESSITEGEAHLNYDNQMSASTTSFLTDSKKLSFDYSTSNNESSECHDLKKTNNFPMNNHIYYSRNEDFSPFLEPGLPRLSLASTIQNTENNNDNLTID
ncbi:hypothetical protein SNEBB_009591 [Seison nebaliae]|nr:hypothetical protein SNEBB_009591 [Seison nebaliae]